MLSAFLAESHVELLLMFIGFFWGGISVDTLDRISSRCDHDAGSGTTVFYDVIVILIKTSTSEAPVAKLSEWNTERAKR